MHSVRRLPAGAVVPQMAGTNVVQADAVRRSLEESLSAVGGSGRNRDVIAVLPDAAVRVLLLDFETLPNDRDEATAIIRFRLKKSLPFDVEHSALSFDRLSSNGQVRAVVALCPAPVLQEYEQAVRDAGYEPSVVVPSVLATLGLVDDGTSSMLVKTDPETTSIVLLDETGLRLLRTIEHAGGGSVEESVRAVHASLIFYEDNTGRQVSRVYLAGSDASQDLANYLRDEGVSAQVLASSASSAEAPLLSPVEGALLA